MAREFSEVHYDGKAFDAVHAILEEQEKISGGQFNESHIMDLFERKTIEHFARKRHPSKTLKYMVGNVTLEHGLKYQV